MGYFKKLESLTLKIHIMGKRKDLRKAAYNKREEEKAKKVLRNVIVGLVVIAIGFIAISQLL